MITNTNKLHIPITIPHNIDIHKSGIYVILCNASGKLYIGQAKKLLVRLYAHQHELIHGFHPNIHLQRAWQKYGESQFEIYILENTTNLNEREIFWIDHFRKTHELYNIREGGGSTSTFSEEHCKHISDIATKKREHLLKECASLFACYPWCRKWPHKKLKKILVTISTTSPDISDIYNIPSVVAYYTKTGQIPESLVKAQKYKLPPWTRNKLKEINLGNHQSIETVEKRRKKLCGMKCPKTSEHKKKLSEANKKKYIRYNEILDNILWGAYQDYPNLRCLSARKKLELIQYIATRYD